MYTLRGVQEKDKRHERCFLRKRKIFSSKEHFSRHTRTVRENDECSEYKWLVQVSNEAEMAREKCEQLS